MLEAVGCKVVVMWLVTASPSCLMTADCRSLPFSLSPTSKAFGEVCAASLWTSTGIMPCQSPALVNCCSFCTLCVPVIGSPPGSSKPSCISREA
jgi:hypothetical protein